MNFLSSKSKGTSIDNLPYIYTFNYIRIRYIVFLYMFKHKNIVSDVALFMLISKCVYIGMYIEP